MIDESDTIGASSDEFYDDLVEEIAEQIEAGQSLDLEVYLARHPQYADKLRRVVPAMRAMVKLGMESLSGGARRKCEPEFPGGALGDYRIVCEIARGGMGVVYEAEQISLGRRVALKVLPFAALLDDRHRLRFQNEARAAATLEHPHIVPIYGVGQDRGVHYYAMKLIQGHSLAQLLEQLRQDHYRMIAHVGVQAASGLEYAHRLGITHRDVKPANLLLDGDGDCWITDFGLAQVESDATLTRTGDLLGTLRYMAPEQARGEPGLVDSRTDIYALGLTLYELLTLRPAFRGDDRARLIRAILEEDPPPPRQINPTIPRDFETIVLKAIDKEPSQRYRSAGELADDLQRFLEHEPIRARRPNLWDRAAKWARRHRPPVASAAALLLVLSAGLGVATVLVERERIRAVANLRLAPPWR